MAARAAASDAAALTAYPAPEPPAGRLWRGALLAAALALIASACVSRPGGVLEGKVTRVRDGDTIEVRGTAVRLNGVDAPELDEPRGAQSAAWMGRLVLGKPVRCELNGERTHDRLVGICYLNGSDIGATLIAAGLARDCPRYSGGRYADLETDAHRRLPRHRYCETKRR